MANGRHFPPKYVVAVAHEVATGELLSPSLFSGGPESNDFLRRRGFSVRECDCGGGARNGGDVTSVSNRVGKAMPKLAPVRHSERCPECKRRVRELLAHIYGTCVTGYKFGWPSGLAPYAETVVGDTLRGVAEALQGYRGFGVRDFVRAPLLADSDFWVPDPRFIVEFDESQHFTIPRKLALSAYGDDGRFGFPTKRWITLCEHHNKEDNHPPFRDEQRAWYDTLRDLVPSIKGMRPTVRLYARDMVWCSLDPNSREDRERFLELIDRRPSSSKRTVRITRFTSVRPASVLRVAMVFPSVEARSKNGVPPAGTAAQRPEVPGTASFAGEKVDFVLFPEGYIRASDTQHKSSLQKLAAELNAPMVVGATDRSLDASGRDWQVLLRFDPDGSSPVRTYVKHSTAEAVAFERSDWDPREALPTFELKGVTVGATICHDHYLGLLPRFLAKQGAQFWVNPSFDNVNDRKWSSVLRLRAVENRFFALCTLHCNENARSRTHPFAFSPDGTELCAREAGSHVERALSECNEAGNIYIVELDLAAAGKPLDWSKLPPDSAQKRAQHGTSRKSVRVAWRSGQPTVLGCSGWEVGENGRCVETDQGLVSVGVIPGERILDAAACFGVLDQSHQLNAAPIIWNHWDRLPAEPARLATLMMGRAVECCAPIVVSDQNGIVELVELSNRNKIPTRRTVDPSGMATIDVRYAWGLKSAFKMVQGRLSRSARRRALERYRSLG
ncbi:MAG: carbon-nitrogen hydrolase family protein [Rhodospirillales bacterium]|nr:carbon-nitrogen hydrolase family protein [Rhodospirillales bacterium]